MLTEILQELSFKKHKDRTIPIFDKYNLFNPKKANEILECGQSLWFHLKEHTITKERKLKLAEMYTCKDRFCPFCNWRRQMKYSKLIYKHLEALHAQKNVRYIFLTLTVPNCYIDDLKATIQHINKSFERMTHTVRWKNSILGYLRVLEYTADKKQKDFIHPHFHVLLVVEPSYFDTKRNLYINRNEFLQMWRSSARDESITQVDIRIVKPNKEKNANVATVAEMCKYPMKDTDIKKFSDSVFEKLVVQLKNVRNINAGGILKGILKKTDKIDDDLINIDDDEKQELWIILQKILYSYENINGNINYWKK